MFNEYISVNFSDGVLWRGNDIIFGADSIINQLNKMVFNQI